MVGNTARIGDPPSASPALRAFLLGRVGFSDVLALQRRLVFDVAGGGSPTVILGEHTSILTVGRHGSHGHILCDLQDIDWRDAAVRWLSRGGGCWLQVPGQLAIYPIISLGRAGLTIGRYVRALQAALAELLGSFDIAPELRPGSPDVWARNRPIACVGVAVREGVTSFGAILNVNPELTRFRWVRTGKGCPPMTSMQRERHGAPRPAQVRERLLECLAAQLDIERTVLFTDHPLLSRKVVRHAIAPAG